MSAAIHHLPKAPLTETDEWKAVALAALRRFPDSRERFKAAEAFVKVAKLRVDEPAAVLFADLWMQAASAWLRVVWEENQHEFAPQNRGTAAQGVGDTQKSPGGRSSPIHPAATAFLSKMATKCLLESKNPKPSRVNRKRNVEKAAPVV